MISFTLDILDKDTGEVRSGVPLAAGWNENCASLFRERICDCNLAGWRENGYMHAGAWMWDKKPHAMVSFEWRQVNGCDHSVPPSRMIVLRAHLQNGDVVELQPEKAAA